MNLLRKIVFVQTSGGLGNQLFQLSNMLNKIKKRKRFFIIFLYIGDKNKNHEYDRLADLNINAKVISKVFALILHKVLILLTLIGIVQKESNKLTRSNPPWISYIRGLYQTPPNKCVTNFLRKKFYIEKSYKRAAIHVRLGDYTTSPVLAEIGLLPPIYFLSCIELLKTYNFPNHIITNGSKKELLDFFGKNPDLIKINLMRCQNDIQELRFLAESNFIVISNSTFSVWAAYLSRSSAIFAPYPWFAIDGFKQEGAEQRYRDGWVLIKYKEIRVQPREPSELVN
jgi:hypothetical protein